MKPSHILVVVIILIVIFGASKLPDIAKYLGQSAKVLKKEIKELNEDDTPASTDVPHVPTPPSAEASPTTDGDTSTKAPPPTKSGTGKTKKS